MLFVVGLATLYSVVIPNALAAGVLASFTAYVLAIAPSLHSGTDPHVPCLLGGPNWSIATYWQSLGIYATPSVPPSRFSCLSSQPRSRSWPPA